jgi:hypothetical protein
MEKSGSPKSWVQGRPKSRIQSPKPGIRSPKIAVEAQSTGTTVSPSKGSMKRFFTMTFMDLNAEGSTFS